MADRFMGESAMRSVSVAQLRGGRIDLAERQCRNPDVSRNLGVATLDAAENAEAAVDRKDDTRDERRRVAAQPDHGAGQLIGSAEPAHRRLRDDRTRSVSVAPV